MADKLTFNPTAQCAGKESFPTPQATRKVIDRYRGNKYRGCKAYHCPHCGAWHIGNYLRGRRG